MRIAYFASSVIPSQKANSIQVVKMCNAFSELGHEVTLFAKSSESINKYSINNLKEYYGIKNSFELYTFSASSIRLLGGLEYGYKVYKKITDLKIDFDIFYGRNLYALTICQKLNKPIIYESHAKPSPGRKILENHLFSKPNFKLLVVINKALYDYYINNFPILKSNPQKVLLAPDGADLTERFTNNKNKVPLIGYAGSLYPGKGIETIIKIAEEMPEYNFAIAGGTDSQINKFKQNNNLKNVFFTGFLTPSQTPDFLSKCDILLAPYSREVYSENYKKTNISDWMSPLKLFNYMASEKPIIASNLPAVKEILEDKKTSLLVDPEDICGWKDSIVKILCKPYLAKELSKNAYELLKSKYTWKLRAEKIIESINLKTSLNSSVTQHKAEEKNNELTNHRKTSLCSPLCLAAQSSSLNHRFVEDQCSRSPINMRASKVVLHIIGDLNVGGAERNMLKIIPRLNNNPFQHIILTLFDYGELAEEFRKKGVIVETANIPRNPISLCTPFAILKLIKAIKRLNPAIIQTWLYHSNNLINILSPFLPTATVINSIRHNDPDAGSLKTKISSKSGAFISKFNPNITVFCSESSKEKHIDAGYKFSKAIVIPNGFIIRETDKEKAKTELKQRLNIPEYKKIAITAARYSKEKDYPTLLKAIKLTLEKNNNIAFILCGKDVDNSNKELMSLVNELNVAENLYLLGHQPNIEKLMAGADFLISSSNSEAFPNVIAEAMSLGISCIAANTGESANIIGNTGLIIEPSNPQHLSEAILKFLDYDKRSLALLGAEAKERIKNNYSLEQSISAYKELYAEICPSSQYSREANKL